MNGLRSIFEGDRQERRGPSLSGAGHCSRQLAYKYHGTEGIPLQWRSLSIFSDGDLFHAQIRQWLHLANKPDCFYLADEEAEVELKTPKGRVIKGHVDGVIHHNGTLLGVPNCSNPEHSSKLLEVKSMSSTGYRMLHREGLEKSYLTQVCSYLQALGLQEAIVLCKCKDTSDLTELIVKRDDALVAEAMARLDAVLDSSTPDMVQRMYGPNDEGKLPWQCGYCPFWKTCWAERKPVEKLEHKLVLTVG